MGALTTLAFILNHPLNQTRKVASLVRYARWQIGSYLVGAPVAKRFVERTCLLVNRGMTGATQNIYCGLHEFEDMAFVLHILRQGEGFIDVGANVGSYTVLAAGVVGARCISIEPIPVTYNCLIDNICLNRLNDRVLALNIGLGREHGVLRFTSDLDTVNHVLEGADVGASSIAVKIERLDAVALGFEPKVIKIDVEGFETNVIAGAHDVLTRTSLLAVIMELNGSGERYGFDESALHKRMLEYGFSTFSYAPFKRELTSLNGKNENSGNTLYIRAGCQNEVSLRLGQAPKFMTNVGIAI